MLCRKQTWAEIEKSQGDLVFMATHAKARKYLGMGMAVYSHFAVQH